MKATFNVLNYSSGSFDDGRKWAKVMCHDDEVQNTDMFSGLHVHTFPIPSEKVSEMDSLLKGKAPVTCEFTLGMTVRQKQTVPTVVGCRITSPAAKKSPLEQ